MQYKKHQSWYLLQLDPGEELVEQIRAVAEKENIALAAVSGLGAVNHMVVGLFDPATRQYASNTIEKNLEIVSLTGSVTTMDGAVYLHLHMAAADADARVYGGHLNSAVVSATAEIFLMTAEGPQERVFSEQIGLNLLDFS